MSDIENKKIKIPGRLIPATTDGVVVGTDVIIDETLEIDGRTGYTQAELNQKFALGESGPIDPSRLPPIGTENLEDNAVTLVKLKNNSVDSDKLKDGSITSAKLAPAVVEEIDGKADANAVNTALAGKASVASVNTLSESVTAINGDIHTINNDIDDLDRDVRGANSRLDGVDTSITRINSSIGGINNDIDDINEDLIHNRYTKTEVNNIVSNTPETDVIIVNVPVEYQSDIPSYLEANIPAAGRPNKLYRVPGPDETSYSEWAWDGTNWVMLANKDYYMDDEPTANSNNTVKSSGLLDYYGGFFNTGKEVVYAVTDEEYKTLFALDKEGDAYLPGIGIDRIVDPLNRVQIIMDSDGRILSYRRQDGTLIEDSAEIKKLTIQNLILGDDAANYIRDMFNSSGGGEVLAYSNGWSIPKDKLDVISRKRADSMATLKWTPKKDYPTRSADPNSVFPANEEVTGVPYGCCYETNKKIGLDVSIETFMTAINNPYSLCYTERIGSTTSRSDWGITYHGSSAGYDGPYYANVCATFVDYAVGLPEGFLSATLKSSCNDAGIVGFVYPQSAYVIKVGDILTNDTHTRMIRDIKYNETGRIESIIITEQADNHAFQNEYSVEDVDSILQDGAYALFRPIEMYQNTDMWDFDANNFVYNNDICTFAGNKANFKEGELIVLNYNLNNVSPYGYTAIELYKDEESEPTYYYFNDILQSQLPADQRGHALKLVDPDVPSTHLTYGNYKARVAGSGGHSEFTEFKIINTEVSVSYPGESQGATSGAYAKIDFSSANAIPISIEISGVSTPVGAPRGWYILSNEDVARGSVTLGRSDFIIRNGGYWIEKDTEYYVKVFFKTNYGRITNNYLENTITFNI